MNAPTPAPQRLTPASAADPELQALRELARGCRVLVDYGGSVFIVAELLAVVEKVQGRR